MISQPGALALLSDEALLEQYEAELTRLGIQSEEEARQVLDLETADLIERLSRIEVEYPLAAAVLWQKPEASWDQRRIVAELVHPLTLVLGGNRGGKTYAILEALVAFALGGDHPAVRAWLEDNDLPRDLIPAGPGECYAVANTAGQSIKIHRLDLISLLPSNSHWRGLHAPDEASVEIPVPGYQEPARIWFKSVQEGHQAFKGDKVRFVAISEEPEGDKGKRVLAECMRACSAVGGRVVVEMTPQEGMTWVYDDLVVEKKFDCRLIEIDSSHNTLVEDHASLMRWLNSLTEEERRMRQYGQFVDRRGLIYSSWSRGTGERFGLGHLVEDFEIPEDWPRFRAGDWGQTKNGTAVLWGALGDDDTLYLYREYYLENEPNFAVHARNVRGMEPRRESIQGAWADHEPEAIAEFAAVGLRFDLANKEVASGISRCAQRLHIVGNRPRLKVFRRACPRFVKEIEDYRRDPNKRDGSPIKKNDHVMDTWRYMENGLEDWRTTKLAAKRHRAAVGTLLKRLGG